LHNAIAGGTHFGLWYRISDTVDGPSTSLYPGYCPKKVPMGTFFNNTVHAVGRFGLWIFPGYTPTVTGRCNDANPSVARFYNFVSYASDKGAEWDVSSSIQFRQFTVYDHFTTGIETQTVIFNQNANTGYQSSFYNENIGALVADSLIIGNSNANAVSSITQSGLVVAWDRGELIKNVTFINFPDSTSHAIRPTEIVGRCM
jgi:hypothetical protein